LFVCGVVPMLLLLLLLLLLGDTVGTVAIALALSDSSARPGANAQQISNHDSTLMIASRSNEGADGADRLAISQLTSVLRRHEFVLPRFSKSIGLPEASH